MVYSIPCSFFIEYIKHPITCIICTCTHQIQTSSLKPVGLYVIQKLVGLGDCLKISSTGEKNELRAAQYKFSVIGLARKFLGLKYQISRVTSQCSCLCNPLTSVPWWMCAVDDHNMIASHKWHNPKVFTYSFSNLQLGHGNSISTCPLWTAK